MTIKQLEKICKKRNITLIGKSEIMTMDPEIADAMGGGLALLIRDAKAVLYNDEMPHDEQVKTIAHEVAHHILGHLGLKNITREAAEREASIFAVSFMADTIHDEAKGGGDDG